MYSKNGSKAIECNKHGYDFLNNQIDQDKYTHLDGWDIYIVRGDSLDIVFSLYKNGQSYIPTEEDGIKIHSQCRMVGSSEFVVWDKEISIEDLILHIIPADTENLDTEYDYVYDVQIESEDGTVVETVIPTPSHIYIIEDVTKRDQS